MKHRIQYQYRPRDAGRPRDYAQQFDLATEEGPILLPSIGDHVSMEKDAELDGVVENRNFHYISVGGETICLINIVLTDSNVDVGRLIKE